MRRLFDESSASQCLALYEAGETLKSLGKRYGCDPATVRNLMIRNNAKRRPTGRRNTCFRYVDANGYVRVKCPGHPRSYNGFVKEHHLVYESAHGEIQDGYDIHHRNGDKQDNRIENLECMRSCDHMRLSRRSNTSGGNDRDPRVVRNKIGLAVASNVLPGFIPSMFWYGEYSGEWMGKLVQVKASKIACTDQSKRWRFSYKYKDKFDLLFCVLLDDEDRPICAYKIPSDELPGDGKKYSGVWLRPEQGRFRLHRIDRARFDEIDTKDSSFEDDAIPF